ncbi:putative carbohydrate-binding protein with CBM5 and CBM33 domain [Paenibacillus cellulosilyticus]|uniref:Putative carbohydrate-binding protein with CBM5 and CBM33 domain n=1 Tax=Paenibacillus cellulosilyticus TaxID=375489 RepID=A0A2V2Z4K2_9BACL|nr:lytic polysaccharide monooxygenase [Paenibacillus cellulosilyticus]PWW08730.1 putative carbohydrate-binding protein with CBM5 and CBM33 domain [Paenibacillus cellulosilyticus]
MVSQAKRSLTNCGAIQYEPQSLEGVGGFPETGPADGQIAGAGKYSELDAQTSDRWTKVNMKGGTNTFTWKFTANHVTEGWRYYITKIGWDPNKPLTRDQLESKPFCTVDGGNVKPEMTVTHTCNVPTDRSGYYIILGVWEIGDTVNAFYQAIDVNLTQDGETVTPDPDPVVLPNIPSDALCTGHTDGSITLAWTASTASAGIKNYEVSRNGAVVGTTTQTSYTDSGLPTNTTYTYTIVAVDNKGNRSGASAAVVASTLPVSTPAADTEAPSRPTGLAASSVTESVVTLSWTASTDNVGVAKYEVYRDGKLLVTTTSRSYTDSGLQASTAYSYTVIALDAAGNRSTASAALSVTTTTATVTPPAGTAAAWDGSKIYLVGDKVTYNGVEYTAGWWTQGEQPDVSEVWRAASSSVVPDWNTSKAYNAGDKVVYAGHTYQAKWWTKGETPGKADVWKLIS